MSLQAQTAKKLAQCLGSHASFKAEPQQCGHDQADEPGAACLCLPQRRLRVAVSAIDRLLVSMHATFGKPSVIRQAPDALLPVLTNRIENDNALGPQSHGVGPYSGGRLTSRKSVVSLDSVHEIRIKHACSLPAPDAWDTIHLQRALWNAPPAPVVRGRRPAVRPS